MIRSFLVLTAVCGVFALAGWAAAQPAPSYPGTGAEVSGVQQSPPAAAAVIVPRAGPAPQVQPAAAQTLPLTGADIAGLVILAAFLISVGTLLVLAGRRHTRRTPAVV